MTVPEKVGELMRTRTGKLFAILLTLTIVFAFSSIAYGTSEDEPVMDSTDIASDSNIQLPDTSGVTEEGSEEESEEGSSDGEGASEEGAEEDAEGIVADPVADGLLDIEQQMRQIPDANAQIAFGVSEGSHASVTSGDGAAVSLDAPFIYEPSAPYTFRVVPDAGYQIESVKVVSKPTTERKIEVPVEVQEPSDATPSDDASDEVAGSEDGGIAAQSLDNAALAEEPEATALDNGAVEPAGEDVNAADDAPADVAQGAMEEETELLAINTSMDASNPFAMSYQIDLSDLVTDSTGHDVAVVITTEEMVFDAWWKVVEALGAGMDVKLGTDEKHGNITVGQIPEGQELTSWQTIDNSKQAVVRASSDGKSNVVLDLNGYQIVAETALVPSADSLISVSAGATLTIEDKQTAKPVVTGSSSEGTLYDGTLHAERAGNAAEVSEDGITYYVTLSEPLADGATTETLYTQNIQIPAEAGKITSSVTEIKNLVSVASGATAAINGGIFTNSAGRAIANNSGTLNMDGGMVFACNLNQDTGAGIYTTGTTTVSGNAVIAGNKVDGGGSKWNGAGISVAGGSLEVSGNALIVGNSIQGDYMPADLRNYNPDGTGGGIFASAGTVTVSGTSRIASNQALYYGGGINVGSGASLTVSQGAVISQNSTSYSHEGANNQDWRYKTMGGGGVHTLGDITIIGGQITGNVSGDGGGAILAPSTSALFTMGAGNGYEAFVSSNYAKMSEGGGIYLMTAAGSKITAGYITNNATDTPYDFGGGGIYVANDSKEVEVWHPIVTNNTAAGFGGGVANCQNGITVSDKAGIFDNSASGESLTNTSVEVDHWIKEQLGLPIESAQDFVGGKRSEIYSQMLGGGLYNWTGYMSYQPSAADTATAEHTVEISQLSWSQKSILLDRTTYWRSTDIGGLTKQPSGYYQVTVNSKCMTAEYAELLNNRLNGSAVTVFREGMIPETTAIGANYYGPKDDKADEFGSESYKLIKDGDDWYWYFAFTLDEGDWGGLDYTKDIWSKRPTSTADINDADWAKRDLLYAAAGQAEDGTVIYESTEDGIEPYDKLLEAAKTITWSGTGSKPAGYELVKWPIAHITQFPDDGFAWSNRIMCLTADPSAGDKANAISLGCLFITGNYSATNGGGIANNGNITIGEDPNDPFIPDETEDEYLNQGSLDITKILEGAADVQENGSVLATFSVAQYANREAFNTGNATMEDIVTFNFTESGSQTYSWPADVRAGNIFVISEIDIEGDNAVDDLVNSNTKVVEVSYTASSTEDVTDEEGNVIGTKTTYRPIALAEFLNRFAPESYMTSVINHYVKGDSGFTFTQGFSGAASGQVQPEPAEGQTPEGDVQPEVPDVPEQPENPDQPEQN